MSSSTVTNLSTIIRRDLSVIRAEIELYPDDQSLWVKLPGCPNSGGTLALHICGNLRFFIGSQIGQTGYERKRDQEFSRTDFTRSELTQLLAETSTEVTAALATLTDDDLHRPSMAPVGDGAITLGLWLTHLAVHLSYHFGQLNYHRRILTGDATSAGGSSIRELLSLIGE